MPQTTLYRCRVDETGASTWGAAAPMSVYVRLTETEHSPAVFTDIWCRAPDQAAKEMLAVALSAHSSGNPVEARLDDPPPKDFNENTAPFPVIYELFVY